MLNKTILSLLLLSGIAASSAAQSVNWANDVAPILYENCVKCHRPGGLGPFSLIGYDNAYTERYSIQSATGSREMPPWKPDPGYRHYVGETMLTEAQIQVIKEWVDNDAPAGDLAQAPPDPVFSSNSEVGIPDHVLMTPFYTITATEDEYRCFVIPNGLTEDAFMRGLEAIPGNTAAIHHILVYEDTTGQGKTKDLQTPEPGYVNFGGPGVQGARLVGAWVPGSRVTLLPPFMGVKLHAGADLIVQVHYPAGTTGMSDVTALNFFFTPSNQGIREVKLAPLLNHSPLTLENGPLNIPANTIKTYHAKLVIPQVGSVVAVGPHMHLIGREITSYGVTPQGDTIPFIQINDWDFHWQGSYMFQKVQKIPFGTVLHAYATYDNTVDNPHQPSFPPQNVVQGESTTDEMMLVYFAYLAYQPGDENIVLDSTLLSSSVVYGPEHSALSNLSLYPNPVEDCLNVAFEIAQTTDIQASVVDMNGRILKIFAYKHNVAPDIYWENVSVADLPPGLYCIKMQAGAESVLIAKFVKL